MNSNEIIIHIPHSSTVIPHQYRAGLLLPDAELEQELLRMTDHFVNDLFNITTIQCHLDKLYDPYHVMLTRKVDAILENHQHCLIIDAHSFPSVALPFEQRSATENPEDRPDICLGYDPFHIKLSLLRRSTDYFAGAGLTVAHNDPFDGSLVPIKHYHQDGRVQSLMVEINRKLYLDEQSGEKNGNYEQMHNLIAGFFEMLQLIN